MIVGITGVFGSGKTTVAKLFVRYGYNHINADVVGHRLLDKGPIKKRVIKEFGRSMISRDKIDRRKLKDVVFYDHKSLIKLNKIMHPIIIKEIKSIISKGKGKVIVDGALLIEARCLKMFDKLIVVKVSKKEQLNRVLNKGKYNKKEIESILKSQLSQKEKLKYADITVDNSKSLRDTKKQVKKIVEELK